MKAKIILYFKHVLGTALVCFLAGFVYLLLSGNSVKFNRNYDINSEELNNEGPYYLYSGDSIVKEVYIHGTESQGYYTESTTIKDSIQKAHVYYYPDSSFFEVAVPVFASFTPEPSQYSAPDSLLIISDIEGGFASFRKLLQANHVVDSELNWNFGRGHLVLAGDFVDRGYFVTQVLYLIYKLEQQALLAGGKVHYILGNHEIMNMQGNDDYAASKYTYAASLMGLRYQQLYDPSTTFLGRWLHSKNVMEKIGNILITHGGVDPAVVKKNLSIEIINQENRMRYMEIKLPTRGADHEKNQLLFSSERSPYWYRGYFTGEVSEVNVDSVLQFYSVKHIVVGHTIQNSVRSLFDGRVIAIDVRHPQEEWGSYFPSPSSEGLLIVKEKLYRATSEGELEEL